MDSDISLRFPAESSIMSENIKVSVILPSYNVTDYIEQCVRSVCAQTLKDIEILCIDAGSVDGTWDKLRKLAEEDARIRLVRSDVKSYGYQMNLGIREATGEYIGIVETDDYVDTDIFEVLYDRAGQEKPDVVKCTLYELYEGRTGNRTEVCLDYIPPEYIDDTYLSPDEHPEVHVWDAYIWDAIYRREFLIDRGIRFQESPGASYQDIAFQQMVLNAAQKMLYIHAHLYHYRKLRNGASTWSQGCVGFICDAYMGLLSYAGLKEGRKRYIYARFAGAFLHELKKKLYLNGFDIESSDCTGPVGWYRAEIIKALNDGVFAMDDVPESKRGDVRLFFDDMESFVSGLRDQMVAVRDWLSEIKALMRDKGLVIFGTGRYGLMLTSFLIRNGYSIDGLADNRAELNNTSFFGMYVMNADDAVRRYRDSAFVIANKRDGSIIYRQLEDKGVDATRIVIFDGSDIRLLEGIRSNLILPDHV